MKTSFVSFGLAIALAGYGITAAAAGLARISGTTGRVLVTQTTATVPAQANMPLNAGSQVATLGNATATVTYSDGCSVTVPGGSTLNVTGAGQCSSGQAQPQTAQVSSTVTRVLRPRPDDEAIPVDSSNLSR